jgi:hypothetical protein
MKEAAHWGGPLSFQLPSAVSGRTISYVMGVWQSCHATGPNWTCYLLTVMRGIDTLATDVI